MGAIVQAVIDLVNPKESRSRQVQKPIHTSYSEYFEKAPHWYRDRAWIHITENGPNNYDVQVKIRRRRDKLKFVDNDSVLLPTLTNKTGTSVAERDDWYDKYSYRGFWFEHVLKHGVEDGFDWGTIDQSNDTVAVSQKFNVTKGTTTLEELKTFLENAPWLSNSLGKTGTHTEQTSYPGLTGGYYNPSSPDPAGKIPWTPYDGHANTCVHQRFNNFPNGAKDHYNNPYGLQLPSGSALNREVATNKGWLPRLDASKSKMNTLELKDVIQVNFPTDIDLSTLVIQKMPTDLWYVGETDYWSENFLNLDIEVSQQIPVSLTNTGPFYPQDDVGFCSIRKDNGELYLSSTDCVAAGGLWTDHLTGQCIYTHPGTGIEYESGNNSSGYGNSVPGGVCTNSSGTTTSHTTEYACTNAGNTWTPNAASSSDWATCENQGSDYKWNPAQDAYNEWRWKMTYMMKDRNGNIVTGADSKELKLTMSKADTKRYDTEWTVSVDKASVPSTSSEISATRVPIKGFGEIRFNMPNITDEEGFHTACGIVSADQNFDDSKVGKEVGGSFVYDNIDFEGSSIAPSDNIQEDVNDRRTATINLHATLKHTFQAGDFLLFKDHYHTYKEGSDVFRFFEILSVTDTTVVVHVTAKRDTGADFTGDDKYWFSLKQNDSVSAGLRLQIWRTRNLGYLFQGEPNYYLVEEVPAQNLDPQRYYSDKKYDSQISLLYEDLVELPYAHKQYPLPKSRYLTSISNTLISSGNPESVGTVYKMEAGYPEVYTGLGSFFTVSSDSGGKITGLGVLNKMLYVFQEKAISIMGGNVATGQVRINVISSPSMGIGCAANATIKEVNGELWFLSDKGIYKVAPGAPPIAIGSLIEPLIEMKTFDLNRALAINWNSEDLYIISIPPYIQFKEKENLDLVYDTVRESWSLWTNVECSRGVAFQNSTGRMFFLNESDSLLCVNQDLNITEDYSDHSVPIPFVYTSNWVNLGDSTQLKRFLRLKVFSTDSDKTFETTGYKFDVTTSLNYNSVIVGRTELDFSKWYAGWNALDYGKKEYGNPTERNKFLKTKLSGRKATSIQIGFKNEELNKNVLLSGYEFEVASPYRPEIKH